MPSVLHNSQVHPGSSPSDPPSFSSSTTSSAGAKQPRSPSTQKPSPVVVGDPSATFQQLDLLRSFLEESAAGDHPSAFLVKELVVSGCIRGCLQTLVSLKSRRHDSRQQASDVERGSGSAPSQRELYENMPPEGIGFVEGRDMSPSAANFCVDPSSRAAVYAPSSSAASTELILMEDYVDDDDYGEDAAASPGEQGRRQRRTANVPKLDNIVLDADGVFVPKALIRKSASVRSSKAETSFNREDSVMDRRRAVSYVNVSNQEKRDVFKLAAVRRSMRHLHYSSILMSDEVLILANKYLEIGPSRASLLQIGYESIQLSSPEKTYYDELGFISPYLKAIGLLRGYHPVMWFISLFTSLCDFGFFGLNAYRKGGIDTITGPVLLSIFFFTIFNQSHCYVPAFVGKPLATMFPLEETDLTRLGYLQLKGLDVLAKAQQRMAREKGKTLTPESDLSVFRKQMVNSTILEAVTVHFLLGMTVVSCATVATVVRSIHREDYVVSILAVGALGNKFFMMLVNANVAIVTRLAQKMSDFEIRRVEADIRTITPNLIHRVTPRFKR